MLTAIWEVIAFIAALLGGFLALTSFAPGLSAPQAAQVAVQGMAIAAIPYFIASMARRNDIANWLKRLAETPPGDL